MTNLNNEIRELNDNELDAVTGTGPILEAVHYAQVVGALVGAFSRPSVEVETGCG